MPALAPWPAPLGALPMTRAGVVAQSVAQPRSIETDALEHLIERVRDGDLAAFEALYRRTKKDVQRVLYHLVGSNAEMEDLVQESYVQLLTAVKRFRGESRFSTFLHRVCANVGLMHLRARRRRPEEVMAEVPDRPAEGSANPEDAAHLSEAAQRMRVALTALTPKKQVVLVYHDILGMGPEEIARAVGTSPNTVRSRLFHARREFTAAVERIKNVSPARLPEVDQGGSP